MAFRRLSMRKIHRVLRLFFQGHSPWIHRSATASSCTFTSSSVSSAGTSASSLVVASTAARAPIFTPSCWCTRHTGSTATTSARGTGGRCPRVEAAHLARGARDPARRARSGPDDAVGRARRRGAVATGPVSPGRPSPEGERADGHGMAGTGVTAFPAIEAYGRTRLAHPLLWAGPPPRERRAAGRAPRRLRRGRARSSCLQHQLRERGSQGGATTRHARVATVADPREGRLGLGAVDAAAAITSGASDGRGAGSGPLVGHTRALPLRCPVYRERGGGGKQDARGVSPPDDDGGHTGGARPPCAPRPKAVETRARLVCAPDRRSPPARHRRARAW